MFESGDDKARIKRQIGQQAIALAMQGRWKEAVAINKNIIESIPTDIDAYNRLGKAYIELGEFTQAVGAYQKTLEVAPNNAIAKKNLSRLSQLQGMEGTVKKEDRLKAAPDLFIGEVGKAGVVSLYRLAPSNILVQMTAGDHVYLEVQEQQLVVRNEQGDCLGYVEPQHGPRIAKLMEGGNKYAAAIVRIDNSNMVKVIIREVFQDPNQAGRLSFPAKVVDGFQPHVKDAILRHGGAEEEYLEEADEGEERDDLEEVELLPDGFSIFEGGASVEEFTE